MGGDIHAPLAFTFCFCFEKKGKKGTHEFKLLDNLVGYAFLIRGCVIENWHSHPLFMGLGTHQPLFDYFFANIQTRLPLGEFR